MRSAVHIKHQKPNTTQLVSCKRTTELTISLPLASTVAFCPASRANLASDGMSSCLLALRSFCWFVLGIQQSWSAQARARRDLLRRRDSPPLANGTLLATQLPLWFLYVSLILRRRGYIHTCSHRSKNAVDVCFVSLAFIWQSAMLPWILRHGKRRNQCKSQNHAFGKFNTKMMDGEE